jgi:ribose transport system substrate-binding protein
MRLRYDLAAACLLAVVAGSEARADDITIANVSTDVGDPYFVSMKCGVEDEAKAEGVKLLWNGSTSTEVAPEMQIFDAIKLKNPDGYILTSFSQTAFIEPVKNLMAQGKPVVLADSTMEQDVFYQGFHGDDEKAGDDIADYLSKEFTKAGKLGIIAAVPGNPIDEARYKDLPAKLAKAVPNLTVLPPQYAKVDSSTAAKLASGLIVANPDLVAIYATNGPQAQGTIAAVRAAKAEDRIKVIAYGSAPDEVEALKSGRVDVLVAQSPYKIGQAAVKSVVGYIKGHPNKSPVQPLSESYATTPLMLLTKANVDSAEAKPFFYASHSCQ